MESADWNEKYCEIEATVVTGFEIQAKEEVIEKLCVEAESSRGKITFHLPVNQCKKILNLSSIDNVVVNIKHFKNFKFSDNLEEALQQFRDLVPQIDWEMGLAVWNEFFSFPHAISTKPINLENDTSTNASAESIDNSNKFNSQSEVSDDSTGLKTDLNLSNGEEPASKKVKADCGSSTTWDNSLPAFRATCYRTGKHVFQSPQVAANFGGEINNYFGWNVSMKKFDIEVIITVERDHIYVSLGLTKESLHRRNISRFGKTTLRPTIAYNMLRFCHIKDAEVVCDPMCGGGSIPVEAALNWPKAVHLCGDIFKSCSSMTKANIDEVNLKRIAGGLKSAAVSVFHWDACKLPLKTGSVDVFITDMPFGKRSGSKLSNWHLYPRVLKEMARVCKSDTGRACLLTQDKKCLLKSLAPIESLWRRGPAISINIGGLAAAVYLLHRTSRRYMNKDELEEDKRLRDEHKLKKEQMKEEFLQAQIQADNKDS